MAYTNTDLISAELGGFTLGTTTTPSEDDVAQWIKQAKSSIDSRTQMTFEPVTVTQELYDYSGDDYVLVLKGDPVLSITTLEYNDQNAGETPSWTAKTEDTDFYLYGDYSEVEFIPGKFKPKSGKRRFRVTYKKGYSIVPDDIKELATKIVAKRVVDSVINSQASVAGGSVAVGTIRVEDPSNFSPAASRELQEDIDRLFDQVVGSFKVFRPTREY